MLNLISSNKTAYSIVKSAIIRGCGSFESKEEIYCFISPTKKDEQLIKDIIYRNSKIVILGKISNELAQELGLLYFNEKPQLDEVNFSHERKEDKSNLLIKYEKHQLNENNPLKERFFYRFDFTNEWNNIGYGAITTDESIWSISQSLEAIDTEVLSYIYNGDKKLSVFSSIKDFENSSILYINREVATIDGLDWNIIEDFLNIYRMDDLPTIPIIKDIPYGYIGIASARLDCDQSIINTKEIIELYKKYNIDISLAVSTGINIQQEDIDFLNVFYENGGDILSHTVNHIYYWGDSYSVAYNEAVNSKNWIEKNIKSLKELKYAVSPFHSNKPYSVQALKDAGYKGFISGIIHNDPEFLVATSGEVPFIEGKIVTHSQQCMLHGDCYHRRKNSIEIEKVSFVNHYHANKIFGYLDHPFGDYDYGWENNEERLSVHEEFINYINSFDGLKWMTCSQILDFIVDKSNIDIVIDENDKLILKRNSSNSKEKIVVKYKGNSFIC